MRVKLLTCAPCDGKIIVFPTQSGVLWHHHHSAENQRYFSNDGTNTDDCYSIAVDFNLCRSSGHLTRIVFTTVAKVWLRHDCNLTFQRHQRLRQYPKYHHHRLVFHLQLQRWLQKQSLGELVFFVSLRENEHPSFISFLRQLAYLDIVACRLWKSLFAKTNGSNVGNDAASTPAREIIEFLGSQESLK